MIHEWSVGLKIQALLENVWEIIKTDKHFFELNGFSCSESMMGLMVGLATVKTFRDFSFGF